MFYQQFPINSRYHSIEIATLEDEEGRVTAYLRRRFLPDPDQFVLLQEHRLAPGERPDHLAARYLNDPEAFWRLADANGVMHPDDLTAEIGQAVRITLPEGVPGIQD